MAPTPQEIEHVVEQFRAELLRMYQAGEIGKIECDCGEDQWTVRSMPIRRYKPVKAERKRASVITAIR